MTGQAAAEEVCPVEVEFELNFILVGILLRLTSTLGLK
jgi:hypothetical protein